MRKLLKHISFQDRAFDSCAQESTALSLVRKEKKFKKIIIDDNFGIYLLLYVILFVDISRIKHVFQSTINESVSLRIIDWNSQIDKNL